MDTAALIVGLAAVFFFLLSYQFPKRRAIIACNVISRVLYILQYLLLGAFAGAALDILGAVSSVVASKKHTPFIKRHTKGVILLMNTGIIVIGGTIALINRSWIDVFSIIGVLLHTSAFWLSDEKIIRRVSLLGSPFWFAYNFLSHAYGSAIGDVLTIVSILIAMVRHREKKAER